MSAVQKPFLRVVRGDATPEEIAALVAVLTARAAVAKPAEDTRRVSAWADRSRSVRTTLPHGPGAWRTSTFPR